MSETSSVEKNASTPDRVRRCFRSGGIFLAIAVVGGFFSWVMAGMDGPHSAVFRAGGVALVLITLGLAVVALWRLARGSWLWWEWKVPTSQSRRGVARFFDALRRNTKQPAHKWPLWAPFVVAATLSYVAYFDHGVFLAKTHEGDLPSEGRLLVESCEPNWTVLGLRSSCTGTVTLPDAHLRADSTVRYEVPFSRFHSADVGQSVGVFRSYGIISGQSWTAVREHEPSLVAEGVLGGSAFLAFLYWYLFVARLVILGITVVARWFRT